MIHTKKIRQSFISRRTSIKGAPRKNVGPRNRETFARLLIPMLLFLPAFLLALTLTVSALAEPIAIMPLGDSITYDNNINDTRPQGVRTGYRQPLWTDLIQAGYDIDFVGSLSAGQSVVPAFDPDNEGHPGWSDLDFTSEVYSILADNLPDIVLLHVGTNDLDANPGDVEEILNQIDLFEGDFNSPVTVVMALIINRNEYSSLTTDFNDNILSMAQNRIDSGDDMVVVDMEQGAGLDYRLAPTGDMTDNLHPATSGYQKMADTWFATLAGILPPPEVYEPEFITTAPQVAYIGIPFQYHLFAKGNPLPEYYLQSGPQGAEVDLLTGVLTWLPDTTGLHTIMVEAVNSQGTDIQSLTVNVETLDKIWIEAESGLVVTPLEIGADPAASGGGFVWSQSGTNGHVDIVFDVAEPGDYIVWGRVLAQSSGSNSFLASMDNQPEAVWDLPITPDWVWDEVNARGGNDPSIFYLDAGRHTLRIIKRETGARLDRLLITSDDTFVPTGTGETVETVILNIAVSGSGSVFRDPELAAYTPGQTVAIEAVPATGWQFDGWSGDLNGSDNPISIVMDSTKNFTARFSTTGPEPQGNKIWMEAESGAIVFPMVTGSDASASEGGFVWSQSGTNGHADIVFDVAEPGDYIVWGRVLAQSSGSNSFRTAMDNQPETTWDLPVNPDWVWDEVNARGGGNPAIFYLEAGRHTLRIIQRETGARLDRLLITSDDAFVPTGTGETPETVMLNIAVSGSGSVFRDPELSAYTPGQTVAIEAVPNAGWQFDGWSGDLNTSDNPISIVMDSPKNVTALFSQLATPEFELLINTTGSGEVMATPPLGPHEEGTAVLLEANADPGWQFDGWSGDLSGSVNPAFIVMDGPKSVTALFMETGPEPEPDMVWIEGESGIVVAPMETGTDPTASAGGFVWSQGSTSGYVEYTFHVAEPGEYVVWGRVIAPSSGSNSFHTAMDNQPDTTWDLPVGPDWVWDRVSARGGDDPSTFFLDAGQHTLSIAKRETGAQLDRLLITSNHAFIPTDMGGPGSTVEFDLAVNVSGSGQVAATPSDGPYLAGSSVVLEAVPAAGWQFSSWSGDLSGTTNPASIVMDGPKSITALFTEEGSEPDPDPDKIWIEGESGNVIASMETGTDPTASAGRFVWSQGSSGGYVEYTFHVAEPGEYVVWGRVIAPSSGSNSFHTAMDNQPETIWDLPVGTDWVWDRVSARGGGDPSTFFLDAGLHTLRIAKRETGAQLDIILITSDLLFQP